MRNSSPLLTGAANVYQIKIMKKTPAVCRMLEDLKISASFEMEMIMEINEALSGQLACA